MGTKFASYSLKLASLHEFYQRLLYGTQPVPSGIEISNTLKFFTQSSLSLLKDVEKSPYDMLVSQNYDSERISLFPNLDYRQLYGAVSQLIDVLPSVHIGNTVLGQALLQCLVCLLPFLDHDSIDTLAYTISSAIVVVDEDMHQEIINYLCFHIFPFTIGRRTVDESINYSSQSVSAVIMIIFEYSKSTAQHGQLLECLMALKTDVVKDILCVIAYGTISARLSAVKLLFYYWPTLIPNSIERRSMTLKFEYGTTLFICQKKNCSNAGSAEATKVCYNHKLSISYSTDSPPPIYLCIECANEIHRENANEVFHDILHPVQHGMMICENKVN
ncbi:protein unc-79 homolog [Trichogramma pretiosum]|uniref:protein unc-79 homolog n=1 Tax=Trichogramma pretiosum TaxID=7493 RepID=UPI000C71BF2B|nr:protein unc-79 homolog [Trichogramma pretiosum]